MCLRMNKRRPPRSRLNQNVTPRSQSMKAAGHDIPAWAQAGTELSRSAGCRTMNSVVMKDVAGDKRKVTSPVSGVMVTKSAQPVEHSARTADDKTTGGDNAGVVQSPKLKLPYFRASADAKRPGSIASGLKLSGSNPIALSPQVARGCCLVTSGAQQTDRIHPDQYLPRTEANRLMNLRPSQDGSGALSTSSWQPLLTVSEVAGILSVSTKTVRRLMARQDLPFVQIGRAVRIQAGALQDFIDGNAG
jgi:excisionase family DNA binding protein